MFENLNTLHVYKSKTEKMKGLQTFVPFIYFIGLKRRYIDENIIKLYMLCKYQNRNGIKIFSFRDENMNGRFDRRPANYALKFIFNLGLSLQSLSVTRIQRCAISVREQKPQDAKSPLTVYPREPSLLLVSSLLGDRVTMSGFSGFCSIFYHKLQLYKKSMIIELHCDASQRAQTNMCAP